MHHPTDSIAHTTAFVTPVVEHWLEQEINMMEGKRTFNLMTHSIEIHDVRPMVNDKERKPAKTISLATLSD